MPGGISPSLVLHSGNIITLDPGKPSPGAVAVLGDRIHTVGTARTVLELCGPDTVVVDLHGRTLIPGLIDNHTHYLLAGLDTPDVGIRANIAHARSVTELLDVIAAKARCLRPGDWVITSCMYRGPLAEGRFPDRHDLDPISPHNPVYVFQSGKNIIVNSLALRMAGIGRHTTGPTYPQGHIVRDASGSPTGHLIAGAADLARLRWWQNDGLPPKMWDFPYYDQATLVRALEAQGKTYLSCGVVGVREMGLAPHELRAFQAARDQARLPVRVDALLGLPARYLPAGDIERMLHDYFGPGPGFGDNWLRIGGIKLVVQNDGWWAYPPAKLNRIVAAANAAGWNLALHVCSGHAPDAVEAVLHALEMADTQVPIHGRHFSYEHGLGLTDPGHIARAARLGMVVAANPLLAYFGAGRTLNMHDAIIGARVTKTAAPDAWRAAVADWGLPLRTWHDAGLLVTAGTDNPAAVYDPAHPLRGLYAAVTGQTLAGVLKPGEQVTRLEVLRMWTVNNAVALGQERDRGTITEGKLADLAVLSGDLERCGDDELDDLAVDATILGGEIAFSRR